MYHEGEKLDEIHIYIYTYVTAGFFFYLYLTKKSILMNMIDDICKKKRKMKSN